jgi:hypothetical protein
VVNVGLKNSFKLPYPFIVPGKLNIYSFFFTCRDEKAIIYKGNGKKLSIKIIEEHENPDEVFIYLESNFNNQKTITISNITMNVSN